MESTVKARLSLAEYNQLEEETNTRYEYHDGEVFAMAGAATDVGDPVHGAIAGNLIRLIGNGVLSRNCTVLTSDVKFYIPSSTNLCTPTYPLSVALLNDLSRTLECSLILFAD